MTSGQKHICTFVNPFTPTADFSLIQNNEHTSPIKLLSVERVEGGIQRTCANKAELYNVNIIIFCKNLQKCH